MPLPITFPILTISDWSTRFGDFEPNRRDVAAFSDENEFTRMRDFDLKAQARRGALVFDNAGRAWKVVGCRNRGKIASGIWALLERIYRVELQVEDLGPYTLDELKTQVYAAMDDELEAWVDVELIAGEDGTQRDGEAMLAEYKRRIGKATTLKKLIVAIEDNEWQADFGG